MLTPKQEPPDRNNISPIKTLLRFENINPAEYSKEQVRVRVNVSGTSFIRVTFGGGH